MNNLLSETDIAAVHEILAEQLGIQHSQLGASAKLHEDLGSDSLDDAEIIMTVEERFDVTIPDDRAGSVRTVGDIQDLLAEMLAEKKLSNKFHNPG